MMHLCERETHTQGKERLSVCYCSLRMVAHDLQNRNEMTSESTMNDATHKKWMIWLPFQLFS